MDQVMEKKLKALATAAPSLPDAIRNAKATLLDLQAQIDALDGHTCVGAEHWRDKNHTTRQPKMQVLHGINQVCPMHGRPDQDQRIRTYVGSDPGKVAAARHAIAQHNELERLVKERRHVMTRINNALGELESSFKALGWTMDAEGNAERNGDAILSIAWSRRW